MEELVRLQKYMADSGIASRRKSEELILEGKIEVNGKKVNELGIKINPKEDKVKYNGEVIKREEKKTYIILNKPTGYVTTLKDEFDRSKVTDLIKIEERIIPVGRLDMYTSGALILTNDGDFIYKVTHPKHEIEKVYNITIKGIITKEEIEKLENGVEIEDKEETYITKKAKIKMIKIDKEKDTTKLEIKIHEGKNRQVRKMCEAIEKKVIALHRSQIGEINIKNLELGKWRYLTPKEVQKMMKT